MAEYTQETQPLQMQTELPEDTLLPTRISGEEAISRPFRFELEMVSTDFAVDGRALLRTPVSVSFPLETGARRTIHGHFRRFAQTGMSDDLATYRAEIVPWPWFLTLRRRRRIFQEKSIVTIASEIFAEWGYSDYDFRCPDRPARDYVVQYDESDWDFICRWLEAEGIFYFFEHGEQAHELVLVDANSAVAECPEVHESWLRSESVIEEDVVTSLVRDHQVQVGKVELRDYDHLQPSFSLETVMESDDPLGEEYEYPGNFEDVNRGDEYARYRLEAREARLEEVEGNGNCRWMTSGHTFRLDGHFNPDANGEYLITAVHHECESAGYRSSGSEGGMDYRNSFHCIPAAVPYRPLRITPWPTVRGAHTATVVGPSGEDVWVDEHGRVKVQFHWDREGAGDENSSCWVRVSSPWAGKGWGYQQVPRIGHEVIVDFVEGDPDRPIVTGRVHNAEQTPPLKSPGNATKSIMRDYAGNEIVMEGTAGEEQVRIHSPYDDSTIRLGAPNSRPGIDSRTKSDHVSYAGGDRDRHTAGDVTERIEGSETKQTDKDATFTIDGDYELNIKKKRFEFKKDISASVTVGATFDAFFGAKTSVRYARIEEINGGQKITHTYETSDERVDKGKQTASKKYIRQLVGADAHSGSPDAGLALNGEGDPSIVLVVGNLDAAIKISKEGVQIFGKSVTITGSDEVKILGKKVEIEGKQDHSHLQAQPKGPPQSREPSADTGASGMDEAEEPRQQELPGMGGSRQQNLPGIE